jgi:hypothetical protein
MELEDLSKDQLIILIKSFHEAADEDQKPYHPDSLMALSLASPEEARRISMRMTPWWTWAILGVAGLIISGFLLIMIFAISAESSKPEENAPWFRPQPETQSR